MTGPGTGLVGVQRALGAEEDGTFTEGCGSKEFSIRVSHKGPSYR